MGRTQPGNHRGCKIAFLWLRSEDVAVERVKERVRLGGHDVPENDIRRRYQRGIINFFDLYQQLAQSWNVYDNSLRESVLVAEGAINTPPVIYQQDLWESFRRARDASKK